MFQYEVSCEIKKVKFFDRFYKHHKYSAPLLNSVEVNKDLKTLGKRQGRAGASKTSLGLRSLSKTKARHRSLGKIKNKRS